ncbi:LuxR C-terminal-related transcriptional regulator [Streptomyces sp. NPDC090025]|uniref:helix-turn-helix transcriptional regulator n=1 Tax=Streptomyces sp. NPDC090025 TaxID=3365922 RepID=UPI003838BAD6
MGAVVAGAPRPPEAVAAGFDRLLAGLAAGRGGIVEIAGDPGSGKTALADALADRAAERGVAVVRRSPGDGLGDGPGDGPGGYADDDRTARPGLVVVLDDLHVCDPGTATALARAIRSTADGHRLLVLVHRPRQLHPALLDVLEEGRRGRRVTRLEPPALDGHDVAALAADRFPARGGRPRHGADFAERLCAAAEGNPRYARMLLAADWDPGLWPERPGTDTQALLREAKPLLREFAGLSARARTTLSAAAVLGTVFRAEDVTRVGELGLDDGYRALAELERADLVRRVDWHGSLTFRHPLVGHVAHADTELAFRIRAHRRALALVTARGGPPGARAGHAEHLIGTDGASALRILAAGARDVAPHRPATAAHWLRLALEGLPDLGGPSPQRTALQIARCRALIAANRPVEARALAHELLGLLGLHHDALPLRESLRAHAVCAEAERQLGRHEEATAIIGAALDRLPEPLPEPLPVEAVELITVHGLAHVLRGSHEQARELLRAAARVPGEADPTQRAVLRVLAALCATHSGDLDEAGPEITHCARFVDALPDAQANRTPELLALLGSAELYLERFPAAVRHLSRHPAEDELGTHRPILLHRQLALAIAEQWTGRLEAAERHAGAAERLAHALGATAAATLAQAIRVTSLVWSGGRAHTAAVAELHQATRVPAPGHSWWATSTTGLLAQAQLLTGDPAGARRTLLEGGGGEELAVVRPFTRPLQLSLLATATLQCGDRAEAGHLVRTAADAARRLGLPVQAAHVRCADALLKAADGDHDAAAALFATAADAFRAAGMPAQYAWTLTVGAVARATSQGRTAALRDLDTAESTARAVGARLVLEQAARTRADLLGAPGPAPATDPGLDALSDREREIATLAATGLRTRRMAEQLFLSPRTVESHLSRIYRKLGVTSRAALSARLHRPDTDTDA